MDADRTSRAYDVVVFGVTGFTGTLVLEYVARLAREGRLDARVRWAAAGRNAAKVREVVRRHCTAVGGPEMAVVEARVEDERSVFAMAGSAWVVMSCVGPYADMGEPVVKACVSMGADYVDVTGEAPNSVVYNNGNQDLLVWVGEAMPVAAPPAPPPHNPMMPHNSGF